MGLKSTFSPVALSLLAGIAAISMTPATVHAEEFNLGEPIVKNEIQVVPNYLTDIEMSHAGKGTSMKHSATHLEADIHAASGEKHGFAEDAWVPYLTVHYTLEKIGSKFKRKGVLLPMTAGDGPHYANNIDFDGPGQYKLTYTIDPPSKNGFLRHVDANTGVPDWWTSFSTEWTFTYPVVK